ncbi:MAG: GNAT family N-acetyltransferase [Oceanospirillaceae bacterium]|nr:GNAT family N-acetyltransferase [Oceanospirillaceae bacterium]
MTASGTFRNHNPSGRTLYGAEVFVNPQVRGCGVGHLYMKHGAHYAAK